MSNLLTKIDAFDLIEFANAFASLGYNIQEQVTMLIECPDEATMQELNSCAMRRAYEELEGFCEELDCMFSDYFEWEQEQDQDEDEE